MLAADRHGAVSGHYRESQGGGVTKTCSFYLSGQEKDDQADLRTWNIETFPGSLLAAEQGVVLRIERGWLGRAEWLSVLAAKGGTACWRCCPTHSRRAWASDEERGNDTSQWSAALAE
jgi:hypothetical protein